jgi:hypothetical protein
MLKTSNTHNKIHLKKSFYLIKYKVQGSLCFWKLFLCYERSEAIKCSGNMQGEGRHLNTILVLLMETLFKASAMGSAPWFSFQSSICQREKNIDLISYWENAALHVSNALLEIFLVFFSYCLRHVVCIIFLL